MITEATTCAGVWLGRGLRVSGLDSNGKAERQASHGFHSFRRHASMPRQVHDWCPTAHRTARSSRYVCRVDGKHPENEDILIANTTTLRLSAAAVRAIWQKGTTTSWLFGALSYLGTSNIWTSMESTQFWRGVEVGSEAPATECELYLRDRR